MTRVIDRAISVHAPWAWALMFGGKGVENRSTKFPRLPVGTRVWIHASLWPGVDPLESSGLKAAQWDTECEQMHHLAAKHFGCSLSTYGLGQRLLGLRGRIVGSVEIHGYATPDAPPKSPWYIGGSLGILVRHPQPLARPVSAKGALGWWSVSKREGLAERLQEAA